MKSPIIHNPAPDTSRFRNINGRLAQFKTVETGNEYWKTHWKRENKIKKLKRQVANNKISELDNVIEKYIGKDGLILEAGSGMGWVAAILKNRGYEVLGVEYEKDAVALAGQLFPDCKFRQGDVFDLDLKDASIKYYLSLGVLEHFVDGYEKALTEAHRVLAHDGLAFISMPYANKRRKLYQSQVESYDESEGLHFYQYYYDPYEIEKNLKESGFEIIDKIPLYPLHFLKNEHPDFIKYIWHIPFGKSRLRKFLEKIAPNIPKFLIRNRSHMLMYVCRKIRTDV